MNKLVINGGHPLYGSVTVQGAKNAVLPLMAAAILTEEEVVIDNCPSLTDVTNMEKILHSLGVSTERRGSALHINAAVVHNSEIPSNLAKELRSSIFLLGSVLARTKHAKVAYPGGCDIGLRPIDIHLKSLADLAVDIVEDHGYIYCNADNIRSGVIHLDYPSVGATENVMLASVFAKGKTVIHNAAREPEIVDLQHFINAMGGQVSGAGSSTIKIVGVDRLHGTRYTTMPDRIVAGTVLTAVSMCGGKVRLERVNPAHVSVILTKLAKTGCNFSINNDIIEISQSGRPTSVGNVDTQPYPGFPTDLQAQFLALATVSSGTTVITENIFETRFKHVPELIKMNANITVKGRTAIVRGVDKLIGTEVYAQDLRGGAALLIAALTAEGSTYINNVRYIDRGYENIEHLFSMIGGDVKRV